MALGCSFVAFRANRAVSNYTCKFPPRWRPIDAPVGTSLSAIQDPMDITLPLDYTAIERILPHRYPFLLVDRITELVPDQRIVGIKNVTLNERYLAHRPGELPVLPPTILTEAIAQVGAILILAKPENREKLPYFRSIERVRYRRPVHPGDVVVIEATVRRLRSRVGVLRGIARVDGHVVVEGTMTFALGPRTESANGSSQHE
jgi:3-hydroxyacyl-[acyl-carrier-protein] dehydratase